MSYWRFFAMIGTSTLVMYGLMYLNTYALDHVRFSESRVYMAAWMGAAMAIVMLAFMLGMYANRIANIAIFAGSIVVFAAALFLFRSQVLIGDVAWMKAMIPHHSIAILTSRRADIEDPRVAKLAAEIVEAQDREISEMAYLVRDIEANGIDGSAEAYLGEADGDAPIESLTEALATPSIAAIDPVPLTRTEIDRALGSPASCTFARAVDSDPILATTADGRAVTKISGSLIQLTGDARTLTADGMTMTLDPDGDDGDPRQPADLVFELRTEPPLRVGYRGELVCTF
ncbi:DUF305 domain-containing protein [uncultured Jannaschia sp.]|uniref:DUF305 domain-containing protein n=1 Tax=uncultured Jannaschia sp. TaxID=293347 RepID=UPI002606B1A5|nr:DUF305 domain-containing protein [uncultured Jannaschia sp.]